MPRTGGPGGLCAARKFIVAGVCGCGPWSGFQNYPAPAEPARGRKSRLTGTTWSRFSELLVKRQSTRAGALRAQLAAVAA